MTMIKSGLGLAGLVAVAALTAGSPAKAEEAREFAWSTTIGATSDYIFRGLSFTQEDPAFQMSIDASYGIAYVGLWGSNLDNGDAFGSYEIDLYAGIKPTWDRLTFDLGAVYYMYPNGDFDETDYIEFKAGVSTELFKGLTAGGLFWYTPDQSNYNETYSVEGTLAYALPQIGIFTPTVSGLVGYTEDLDASGSVVDDDIFAIGDDSYTYWNAGITLAVEKFSMDFRYHDTDVSSQFGGADGAFVDDISDERFVFTAKVTLP
jgi:uncharacterized protein (TIGR02001 family)